MHLIDEANSYLVVSVVQIASKQTAGTSEQQGNKKRRSNGHSMGSGCDYPVYHNVCIPVDSMLPPSRIDLA